MSRFTTRVELYGNPSYSTYEELHKKMQIAGFTRQITLGNVKKWLPNAEYTWEGTSTAETVKTNAVKVTSTVWTDFGVMVTATEVTRAFHNLKNV